MYFFLSDLFIYLFLRYMKYLYPYECERKGFSSPGELQAAIDSNRREGRRPSYSSSLFRFSPSPSTAPHILSPPKMHLSALAAGTSGALNGLQASPGAPMKKGKNPSTTVTDARRASNFQHTPKRFLQKQSQCLKMMPSAL